MKKMLTLLSIISIIVCVAFSWLMDVKTWKDLIKNLICSYTAAVVVFLIGIENHWSEIKILAAIILASAYARPVVFGINRQIKEFFKDPKTYFDKFRS